MKGDSQLSKEQVVGIQRLVAASVSEIEPGSVTILDQRGVALTRNGNAENEGDAPEGRFETKKEIESYLTKKVVDVLDRALGPGQAIVSIDVTLNLDQVKTTREDVIPLSVKDGESIGAIARRKQTDQGIELKKEVDIGTVALESGKKDMPRVRGASTMETEYLNGRKVEQTVSMPGSIKRLSIGVLLPNNLDAEHIQHIREVVKMAAGLSENRGDAIAVYSIDPLTQKPLTADANGPAIKMPNDMAQLPESRINAMHSSTVVNVLWYLLASGVILLFVFVLLRQFVQSRVRYVDGPKELSEEERLQTLAQVRQWMEQKNQTEKIAVQS
jgi:flagellar M-ring protein FliF